MDKVINTLENLYGQIIILGDGRQAQESYSYYESNENIKLYFIKSGWADMMDGENQLNICLDDDFLGIVLNFTGEKFKTIKCNGRMVAYADVDVDGNVGKIYNRIPDVRDGLIPFLVKRNVSVVCELFAQIAESLSIKYRFCGSEPIDKFTNSYNRQMSALLPQYGIKFIEIDRKSDDGNEVISASRVRRAIKERDVEAIAKMVPETTILYLKKYMELSI